MTSFGGLHPRIEDDFKASARALHVDSRFEHGPDAVVCTARNHTTEQLDSSTIKGHGTLDLTKLSQVCRIQESVLDYDITPRNALSQLEHLMNSDSEDEPWVWLAVSLFLPAVLCALFFNGSCLDMLAAGLFAVVLCIPQLCFIPQDMLRVRIYEYDLPQNHKFPLIDNVLHPDLSS